jgi:hypothetical protein
MGCCGLAGGGLAVHGSADGWATEMPIGCLLKGMRGGEEPVLAQMRPTSWKPIGRSPLENPPGIVTVRLPDMLNGPV